MKFDRALHLPRQRDNIFVPIISGKSRRFDRRFPTRDVSQWLCGSLSQMPIELPLIVMVHGQGFSPMNARTDPFSSIFAFDPYHDTITPHWLLHSWASRFSAPPLLQGSNVQIGYGWHAQSDAFIRLANFENIASQAMDEADQFAEFLKAVEKIQPERKIHLISNGLGAKVILRAMEFARLFNIERCILLESHATVTEALLVLNRKSTRNTQFYNIFAKPNRRLRFLNAKMQKSGPADQMLAFCFPFQRQNWVDIPLDDKIAMANVLDGPIKPLRRPCTKSFATHLYSEDLIRRILFSAKETSASALKKKMSDRLRPFKMRKAFFPHYLDPLIYFKWPA